MDPVLQFQPWLEFNRAMIRAGPAAALERPAPAAGRPTWPTARARSSTRSTLIAYLGTLPDGPTPGWPPRGSGWPGWGCSCWRGRWGLGAWGRWFAGLVYPVLRLPGRLAALSRSRPSPSGCPGCSWRATGCCERPGPRAVGLLALVVGLVLLGGHVQTSAHVLLARRALRALAARRSAEMPRRPAADRAAWPGARGSRSGSSLAAVEIVPLGVYLAQEPGLGRSRARAAGRRGRSTRPRLLDAVCTALPYAFGSQRRGHPNLAQGAGGPQPERVGGRLRGPGHAGLAGARWRWSARRRQPRVAFLAGLAAFGALGAFGFPPVDNLLRALPVLDVTDNRRLTLWVAFGLVAAGWDRARRTWPAPIGAGDAPGSLLARSAAVVLGLGRGRGAARSSRGSASRAERALRPSRRGDAGGRLRRRTARGPSGRSARPSTSCRATYGLAGRRARRAGRPRPALRGAAVRLSRRVRPVLLGADAGRPARLRLRPEPGDRRRRRPAPSRR